MSARASKRVVVTGGSGRVGRYVVAELQGHHDVVNADRVPSEWSERVAVEVTDLVLVRRAVAGADVVVHLAALDYDVQASPEEYVRVNTLGTWHVLQAAAECGVRRVVLCSSVAALGLHDFRPGWTPQTLPVTDAHEARPVEAYGASKSIVEVMGRAFADGGRIEVVCLRPCAVVFEENLADFVADEGGPYLADYVTGEDVATACRAAVETERAEFGPFLLSAPDTSHPEPTLDWYARRFGGLPPTVDLARYQEEPRAAVFDAGAACRALGWWPTSSRDQLRQRYAQRDG